ncbi:hypothetical protein M2428_004197 [Arthrobacter sp. ES3-54]|nr:hypothetical protein [Arthrobacter sp. ES3-54]
MAVLPSVTKRPPIRIVHPLARDAIAGHFLRAAHDRPIISWVTGTFQDIIGIYVGLDFAILESDVVGEICPTKY